MPDITSISAFITSIKNATDIARFLSDVSSSFKDAETKNKIADLLNLLADAKLQIAEIKEDILEKDKTIKKLKETEETEKLLIPHDNIYIIKDGDKKGSYCTRCWDAEKKLVRLHYNYNETFTCPNCKNFYDSINSCKASITFQDPIY